MKTKKSPLAFAIRAILVVLGILFALIVYYFFLPLMFYNMVHVLNASDSPITVAEIRVNGSKVGGRRVFAPEDRKVYGELRFPRASWDLEVTMRKPDSTDLNTYTCRLVNEGRRFPCAFEVFLHKERISCSDCEMWN